MWGWIGEKHRRAVIAGLQSGAAAGLAWWLARMLLDNSSPIYAPVAAVVVIGAGYERRVERVTAMLSGMALAVAVSEVGVRLVGSGAVQIGALTALSIVLARFVLDDLLAVTYAGLNAALLVALGGEGWVPDRLLEGAVGAGTAYALVYLVFPPRPSAHIRQAVSNQVSTAVGNLRDVADALRSADRERADRAQRRSDRVDRTVGDLVETFDFSQEVSSFSPWRWRERPATNQLRCRAREFQAVLRDATALVRVAGWHVQDLGRSDDHLAAAIEAVADGIATGGELVATSVEEDEKLEALATMIADARRHADADRRQDRHAHIAVRRAIIAVVDRLEEWIGGIGREETGQISDHAGMSS